MTAILPAEFADLEPYAPTWCLATEAERWNQRVGSSMQELTDFYDAAFPRLEAAIDWCDRYPLEDMPDEARHLLQLIYSLAQVSMAVEVFGQQRPTDSADAVLQRVREPSP